MKYFHKYKEKHNFVTQNGETIWFTTKKEGFIKLVECYFKKQLNIEKIVDMFDSLVLLNECLIGATKEKIVDLELAHHEFFLDQIKEMRQILIKIKDLKGKAFLFKNDTDKTQRIISHKFITEKFNTPETGLITLETLEEKKCISQEEVIYLKEQILKTIPNKKDLFEKILFKLEKQN